MMKEVEYRPLDIFVYKKGILGLREAYLLNPLAGGCMFPSKPNVCLGDYTQV